MTQLGFSKTSALRRLKNPSEHEQKTPEKSPYKETQAIAFTPQNASLDYKEIAIEQADEKPEKTQKNLDLHGLWDRFCRWVTSTDNRIYIGWFGVIAIPTLSTAAIVFVLAIIAAPAVDMEGTGHMVAGSLLAGNNLITAAVVPTSAAIGLHFYPIWKQLRLMSG